MGWNNKNTTNQCLRRARYGVCVSSKKEAAEKTTDENAINHEPAPIYTKLPNNPEKYERFASAVAVIDATDPIRRAPRLATVNAGTIRKLYAPNFGISNFCDLSRAKFPNETLDLVYTTPFGRMPSSIILARLWQWLFIQL